MKVLCLLLFCLSFVAAIRLGYKRGKRYTYQYKGCVANGIPDAFEKDLALRIRAKAHLDYLMNGDIRMTLEGVKLAKVVDKVLYNDRAQTNNGEEEVLEEVNAHFKKCLEKPIKFRFKQAGIEKEIRTETGVREWCVNVQRAIANHLYLPIKNNEQKYQIRRNEVTVLGKCRTVYALTTENPYYEVKRVINLNKCSKRPRVLQISVPNSDAFYQRRAGRATAKELPNFERSAAYMHYRLEGDQKKGFIIYRVVSENVEELTLNGDQYQGGKAVAAHSRQEFTLCAKDQPIPKKAKKMKTEQKRGGLLFIFDDDRTDLESEAAQKNILRRVRARIATINQHLQGGNIKADTAVEFSRLVSTLRQCTDKSLRVLLEKDVITCTNQDVKNVLLDAISRVGTQAAGAVLKECVTQGKLNKQELRRVTFGIGWVRCLNVEYMKDVLAICQDKATTADAKAQRNCWLTCGTLVNRLVVKMRRNPRMAKDMKLVLFRQQFAKTLKEAIQNANNNEEKITYLKAAGNAGWTTKDVFKIVCDQLNNAKTLHHVRLQAIWALRQMARVKPTEVRSKLLPYLANPLVDPEIRISCYKILIHNDPSLLTCQMIAGVIAREAAGRGPRSNQLVSFVASDLRTSINYDYIDRVKASRARLLLRLIPRAVSFQMFSYSKGINIPIDTGNNIGVEVRLNQVNSPQTFLPRHIHTKIKFNMPGISADLFEFGIRTQGIHDVLMPFLGPKGTRQKRSLDILNYIFGVSTEEEVYETRNQENGYQKKYPARLATYFKLFGSEYYANQLTEAGLLEIIRDALFGQTTAQEGGCTFDATNIKCKMSFTRAHMVIEKRYMIPTLAGIALKYSGKAAVVVKGRMAANVTGLPTLFTTKFNQVNAKLTAQPTTSFHMHHKFGVWMPCFETGVIAKHQLYSSPNINFGLTVNKRGFKLEAPIAAADQELLALKPDIHAVMRKELAAGQTRWTNIDLQLRERGFVEIPQTCYGKQYFNLMLCKEGRVADVEFLRLKQLQTFPYKWLNQLRVWLKKDDTNTPTKFEASYQMTTNTDAVCEGKGVVKILGETMETDATMNTKCDKCKWTCNTKWTFKHKQCPQTCNAETYTDYSRANRLAITTKYGGDKEMNNEFLVEKQGKTLRIVNTWNKLPEGFHDYIRRNYAFIVAYFYRFFEVKSVSGKQNKCEIKLRLANRFVADVIVNTPSMQLRRINQQLPFALNNFNLKGQAEMMMKRFYGVCVVKGTNQIETTDNVIIKEEIPSNCPFVLARDAREEGGRWRILLRKALGERQNLFVEMEKVRIEFEQDKSVKVNGKKVDIKPGTEKDVTGGKITSFDNKLYLKADCGFQIMFDGSTTIAYFSPWYHNRVGGMCGNNDGEQWTDFCTRRRTYMPERMTKEFVRDWIVEGTTCKDRQCQLKARHIKLKTGAPRNKACYSIGRFLRCMTHCTATKKQRFEKVACHCLDVNDPLISRIRAGDPTVALETKSVDAYGAVEEHVACQCNCS